MCSIHQTSSPSLDSAKAFDIVNVLFIETQPNPISILPLDLRDSIYILSTVVTLLNTSLQQGGGIDVLNTMVSCVYLCMFSYSALLDYIGCGKQHFE